MSKGWGLKGEDYLCEKGAYTLAAMIRNYWADRGVLANVWVEPGSYSGTSKGPAFWVVRSNISLIAGQQLGT